MKLNSVASIAFLGQTIKLISGPAVLLVLSKELSSAQMAIYFTFFSLIAVQQILEMGLGFTIKQFIAHSYKTKDNIWTLESKEIVKGYLSFSLRWYFVISLFVLIFIGGFGLYFFTDNGTNIEWKLPWILVILLTAFFVNFIPYQFLIDGCQDQKTLYKARLVSSTINASSLMISLSLDFELYSLVISIFLSNLSLYLLLFIQLKSKYCCLSKARSRYNMKTVFNKVWPMLSKLSVTWIFGYFFWNAFNLIAIKMLNINTAGKLAFTLSLALAGYNISSVIINSQTTVFSQLISNGNASQAVKDFNKSNHVSIAIIILGYVSFLFFYLKFDEFYFFEKVLPTNYVIPIFIYFTLLLPIVNQANFARCYKKEPYFTFSLCLNISVPLVFLIICVLTNEPAFVYLLPLSVVFLIWSKFIFDRTILKGVDKATIQP